MSKSRNNSGWLFAGGLALGGIVGAAVAYFSDEKKRKKFVKDLTEQTDHLRDDIVDAYYDSKLKARKTKRDISRYLADVKDEAETVFDDVVTGAKNIGKKGKETAEELIDVTEEELANFKNEAREAAERIVDSASHSMEEDK